VPFVLGVSIHKVSFVNPNVIVPFVSGRLLIVSLTVAVRVVVWPEVICVGLAVTVTAAGSATTWTVVVAEEAL
jgi:hypothetical protein